MAQEFWRWKEYNWQDPNKSWENGAILTGGVDVGSVSTQAVVMSNGTLCAFSSRRTGSDSPDSAPKAMDGPGLPLDQIKYIAGPGYGRVNVPFANRTITEIACHARGANFMYGPTVRTVLDMEIGRASCRERG